MSYNMLNKQNCDNTCSLCLVRTAEIYLFNGDHIVLVFINRLVHFTAATLAQNF